MIICSYDVSPGYAAQAVCFQALKTSAFYSGKAAKNWCKFTHKMANKDPHMLQSENAIIYFIERFESRGHRSHSFRRLEKGGHTSIARFPSLFFGW